jgi:RNase P/RNase MRP subunit POP5
MVRVKRRYFVFQCHLSTSNNQISIQSFQIAQILEKAIARYYGDYGAACFLRNLSIIYCNEKTGLIIVRCLRDDKHLLQTASTFITKFIDDLNPFSFQTLHLSGSIRQCKRFLVKYSIEQLLHMNQSNDQPKNSVDFHHGKRKQYSVHRTEEKKIIWQKLLLDCQNQCVSTIGIQS